ncbi:MAG: hypothetical protein NT027_14475 [Proteobacteria bacterium]|nr:hypothetical protein [Pseudomonadota bacterium]
MKSRLSWLPSISFLITASLVTLVFTSSFTLNLFPNQKKIFADDAKLFFLALGISANLVSLFISGFAHALSRSKDHILKDDRVMISSIGVIQAGVVTLGLLGRMSAIETLIVINVFQIWTVFLFFALFAESLDSAKQKFAYLPHLAAVLHSLYIIAAFPLRNWFPVPALIEYSSIWQGLSIITAMIGALVWLGWNPNNGLNQRFLLQSIKIELSKHKQVSEIHWTIKYAAFAGLVPIALTGVSYLLLAAGPTLAEDSIRWVPQWTLAGISTLFGTSLYLSWKRIRILSEDHAELSVSSKLAGKSAERFLRKNLRDENTWAASVGLRTSIFTVDHDPEDSLSRSLPASLLQIRNEEIGRCINDVLGGKTLNQQSVGQRVVGALDPELSTRPCTEIVKMFAAMYLDAGPLIERRINGLSTLLPIINPGLANVLRSNNLTDLLKRAQWFFHFDYKWVDQSLINTPQTTRYGVHMDPLSNELRNAMIAHLKKSNALGSFLWMGRDAHSRLLQEAPMLAPIIETVTISGVEGGDHLVFTMKFEHLIPRLQRYFELDKLRQVLMDFEISADAGKLINIFKVQMTQAFTPDAMLNVVESVASYPWRGFKEKDQALKLVVQAHQYAQRVTSEYLEKGEAIPRQFLKLRESVQSNVEKIGYPAQILHLAQMHKIALRDILNLIKSAKNKADPRFEESWTLLGNLDMSRYARTERKLIADLLTADDIVKQILAIPSIQPKAIDAIINLAKGELQIKDFTLGLDLALDKLISELAKINPTPETISLLLDGVQYLSELSGKVVPRIDSQSHTKLEEILDRLEKSPLPFSQALTNRRVERRQKLKNIA